MASPLVCPAHRQTSHLIDLSFDVCRDHDLAANAKGTNDMNNIKDMNDNMHTEDSLDI